jgi:hypothetical protein
MYARKRRTTTADERRLAGRRLRAGRRGGRCTFRIDLDHGTGRALHVVSRICVVCAHACDNRVVGGSGIGTLHGQKGQGDQGGSHTPTCAHGRGGAGSWEPVKAATYIRMQDGPGSGSEGVAVAVAEVYREGGGGWGAKAAGRAVCARCHGEEQRAREGGVDTRGDPACVLGGCALVGAVPRAQQNCIGPPPPPRAAVPRGFLHAHCSGAGQQQRLAVLTRPVAAHAVRRLP